MGAIQLPRAHVGVGALAAALPGAEAIDPDPMMIVLSVEPTGQMYLNLGDPEVALPPERVVELVASAMRREPGRPVLVKADRAVPYGRVVEGMVLLQQAGARKVGFVTQPVQSDAREAGAR